MFKLWKPGLTADVQWRVDWTDPSAGPRSQGFAHWREGLAFMMGLAIGRREQPVLANIKELSDGRP